MNVRKKSIFGGLAVVSALGMSAAFVSTASAANQPTYDTAVVDGLTNEWDLSQDLFSKMCEAGSVDHSTGDCDNKDHLSNLYLRYDCSTNTMYALVLREGNYWPEKFNDEAWVKVYQLGNKPVAGGYNTPAGSEFSWVAPNGTANIDLIGYEASFPLAPDPYDIEAHINIDPDRTSSTGKKANPLEISVQCDTPINPSIDIETHTNGIDADDPTGPVIDVGNQVSWSYWLENDGNVPLTNVTVTDDQGVTVTCPQNTLAVGEVIECTASGTATNGQYANIGSVTGDDPYGTTVDDADPSHYFGNGTDPDIDIEYSTNTVDADNSSGPIILVGETVTWDYLVTNIGDVDLQNIVVTDNLLGTITCPYTSLLVGESMICTTTGIATTGQYANYASVTGEDSDNTPVSDQDYSHYYGAVPSLNLEKLTQGDDADNPTGPFIKIGYPVFWMFEIENTGNVDLENVVMTDNKVSSTDINCGEADMDNVISVLHMGETKTCKAQGIATAGQYENTGTATTTYTDDFGSQEVVTDTDDSHYFGIEPEFVKPYCEMTFVGTNANGDKYIEVTIRDIESGLLEIEIRKDVNATVTGYIAGIDFPVPTTDDVIVTATKINQAQSSVVELKVTDAAQNVTICDPVITVETRGTGQPVTNTFTDIPEVESNITVKNGDPGIKNIEVLVNGNKYNIAGLQDNEVRTLDVSTYMKPGNSNIISLTSKGQPGGTATVVISD